MSDAPKQPSSEPVHQMTLRRTFSQSTRSAEERVKEAVIYEAFNRGMWGGLWGGLAGGIGMFFANKYNWMGIRKGLSVSGKTGLIVTAFATPFWLRSEMCLVEGQRHPERFVPQQAAETPSRPRRQHLPMWQQALNFVHDNPFQTWGSIVLPAYGAIFAYESYLNPSTANMVLSQRIIHTRVIGQFTAISVLLGVGMINDRMHKSGGRFELPQEDEDDTVRPADPNAVIDAYAGRTRDSGVNWNLLIPLMYAPLFPLIRIGLRNRVTKRQLDLLTGGTIAVALAHAGYIMAGDSTMFA